MPRPKREPHYVDVVERVFCGLRVNTGNELASRPPRFDGRLHIARLSRSPVSIRYGADADRFADYDPVRDRE